jgi:hypothetical protein
VKRTLLKNVIFVPFLACCTTTLAHQGQNQATFSCNDDNAFVRLSDGTYAPLEQSQLQSHNNDEVSLSYAKQVVAVTKKRSFIQKMKQWFVSPFDFSVPVLGNIKKLYYLFEYQVTIAAQELHEQCLSHSLMLSKEQTVWLAKASFFNLIGRWLTPLGLSDAAMAMVIRKQIPVLAQYYTISNQGLLGHSLYSLYTSMTREIDLKWYCAAFLYHVGMRPEINKYLETGGYKEMFLLSFCAPGIMQYLSW